MKRTLLAAAVMAAIPFTALAQQVAVGASGLTYIVGRLGVIAPQHDDLDGFDNGAALEFAVGHRIAPNFAVEGSLGRFSMSASQTVFDPVLGSVNVKADFAATSVLGTVKAIAPLERIDLYGLVGGGLYFVSMDGTVSQFGSASDSGTSFGFHLGGGLSANLTPNLTGGVELKYILGTVTLFDEKGHYDSLLATAQLGYRF